MKAKTRAGAFLLALLLFCLSAPAGAAGDTVYFTAVNNTLLELSDATMPVIHNSIIYIPAGVFNTRALETYAYYSRENQTVLISDGESFLYFDMSAGSCYDNKENTYRSAAIYVNDTAYVPAFFVAGFFGLGYSYIRQDERHIVRLTRGSVLSDADFFSAASSLMETRMNQYLAAFEPPAPTPAVTPAVPPSPTPSPQVVPTPAVTPEPGVTPPPETNRSGVRVHLCFLGLNEESAALLTQLDGTPACFFATAGELYIDGDLVRGILGSRSSVGLLSRGDPAGEYGEFAQALRDTAMSVTFLCAGVGMSELAVNAAADAGLCFLSAQEAVGDADAAIQKLIEAEDRCDLFLSGHFSGLGRLLDVLKRDHYTLESVTEVTMGGQTP